MTEYICPICDRDTLQMVSEAADMLRCPSCGTTVPRASMETESRRTRLKLLSEEAAKAFHVEVSDKLRQIQGRRSSNRSGRRYGVKRVSGPRAYQQGDRDRYERPPGEA